MFWIGLGIGIVTGSIIGVIIMACCVAAKEGDRNGNN